MPSHISRLNRCDINKIDQSKWDLGTGLNSLDHYKVRIFVVSVGNNECYYHFILEVVIGFSEDDYTGDEGEPGDLSRPNSPCTVVVELIERTLEIPLQIQLTPTARNATGTKCEIATLLFWPSLLQA